MKTTTYFAMFSAILGVSCCYAYTFLAVDAVNKDFPGECYDSETKIHFKPGETRQRPNRCEEMTCGSDFTISYFGCGLAKIDDPNCVQIEQDFSKDYPVCCRKYKCVVDENITYD
ncbi:toxin-like protein 14 isoform X1 [Topomyia yanbarensis]|uniref:toxin-like protein 14 isoform X1 n=1 Tax=Topomyia yanbarensis TaxID=2498891 RepID=UPI00273CCBA6|nr:toxin-like protein 14 isoform X1 [Topomyia yanbarensis]